VTRWHAPVAFDPERHRTRDFSSGEPRLDTWLKGYAGQGRRRDASRTFVAVDEGQRVVGYYTLVAGEVDHAEATVDVRSGLSRQFPVPVCLLVRLAVDERHQGRGVGAALLVDALARAARAAEQVGIRAVIVHALHPRAAGFYRNFGLQPLEGDELTLMTTVAHIRASIVT
jgi:GNAT superfamily N-acetyltransferase